MFGVRRGIRPAQRLRGSRIRRRRRLAVLDLLDALVRKSLLVADRSAGRTRYSMLETIRQFAEEQLVARGQASEIRAAHSRYFAGREPDIMALWDSPRQRQAYTWFTAELSNLRTAFRWAADQAISTAPWPSPSARHSSALWSNSTSPLGGQRNSLNLHAG